MFFKRTAVLIYMTLKEIILLLLKMEKYIMKSRKGKDIEGNESNCRDKEKYAVKMSKGHGYKTDSGQN